MPEKIRRLQIGDILPRAAQEVLNALTKSQVRPVQSRRTAPVQAPGLIGEIEIHGERQGRLRIMLSRELAAYIGASMAGCESSDLDDAGIQDGVAELANQIAGRLKTLVAREGKEITIGLPHVKVMIESSVSAIDAKSVLVFECMDNHIALQFIE